jgi:hypothetical protein
MPECRCRTEADDYRKKCRCRTNFYPAFRHLHMIIQYNIARITTSEAVYGRAGCIHFQSEHYGRAGSLTFHRQQYERAGRILIPQPAVWTIGHAGRVPLHHQYGLARCVAFHSQQNGRAGSGVTISTARSMDVQCAGCMCFHCQPFDHQQYGSAGCTPFLNVLLSCIQSVWYSLIKFFLLVPSLLNHPFL